MHNYNILTWELEELMSEMGSLKQQLENFDKGDHFSDEDFRELLNDSEPLVEVCGATFMAGDVLVEMDPIAFSESYHNFLDIMEIEEFPEYMVLLEKIDELQGEIDDLEDLLEEAEELAFETEDF